MNTQNIFRQLIGLWKFARYITGNVAAKVIGTAEFSATSNENELIYVEQGILEIQSSRHAGPCCQSYFYRLNENDISVFFTDGRMLHKIAPDSTAIHKCNMDLYKTNYGFTNLPQLLVVQHMVIGPHKNYLSTTDYRKKSNRAR